MKTSKQFFNEFDNLKSDLKVTISELSDSITTQFNEMYLKEKYVMTIRIFSYIEDMTISIEHISDNGNIFYFNEELYSFENEYNEFELRMNEDTIKESTEVYEFEIRNMFQKEFEELFNLYELFIRKS